MHDDRPEDWSYELAPYISDMRRLLPSAMVDTYIADDSIATIMTKLIVLCEGTPPSKFPTRRRTAFKRLPSKLKASSLRISSIAQRYYASKMYGHKFSLKDRVKSARTANKKISRFIEFLESLDSPLRRIASTAAKGERSVDITDVIDDLTFISDFLDHFGNRELKKGIDNEYPTTALALELIGFFEEITSEIFRFNFSHSNHKGNDEFSSFEVEFIYTALRLIDPSITFERAKSALRTVKEHRRGG